MLSTTAEYALRIMVSLAGSDSEWLRSEEIAAATKVPCDYSVKILHQLGRAGLVRGQRGRGGGYRLECDPDTTNLYDVVTVIDPLNRITKCPLGLHEHSSKLCSLHRRLDDILGLLEQSLKEFSINDLLAERTNPGLCDMSKTMKLTIGGKKKSKSKRK